MKNYKERKAEFEKQAAQYKNVSSKTKKDDKKRVDSKPKYTKPQEEMRINKFISHNAKYSRREADKLLEDGSVTIMVKLLLILG